MFSPPLPPRPPSPFISHSRPGSFVLPPTPTPLAGTSLHRRDGMSRAGAACRVSSAALDRNTYSPAAAMAAPTSSVPRRQWRGSAYQPPAGDQTPGG